MATPPASQEVVPEEEEYAVNANLNGGEPGDVNVGFAVNHLQPPETPRRSSPAPAPTRPVFGVDTPLRAEEEPGFTITSSPPPMPTPTPRHTTPTPGGPRRASKARAPSTNIPVARPTTAMDFTMFNHMTASPDNPLGHAPGHILADPETPESTNHVSETPVRENQPRARGSSTSTSRDGGSDQAHRARLREMAATLEATADQLRFESTDRHIQIADKGRLTARLAAVEAELAETKARLTEAESLRAGIPENKTGWKCRMLTGAMILLLAGGLKGGYDWYMHPDRVAERQYIHERRVEWFGLRN
jgi:hypothetical protein